jgi:dipeptidyl aminopeptidase/acylaminoacyl peptidase
MKSGFRLLLILCILVSCSAPLPAVTPSANAIVEPSLTPVKLPPSPTPLSFETETPYPTITPTLDTASSTPTADPAFPKDFYPGIPEGSYVYIKPYHYGSNLNYIRAVMGNKDLLLLEPPELDWSVWFAQDYAFSNDGKLYAFVGHSANMFRYPPVMRVLRIKDDQNDFVLTGAIENADFCHLPSFAPDGQHMLMVCPPAAGHYYYDDIYLVDLLTGNRVKITSFSQTTESDGISALSWSPDGKTIAFVHSTSGLDLNYDPLYIMDASCLKDPETCSSKMRVIAKGHFFSEPIAWSPDSQKNRLCG